MVQAIYSTKMVKESFLHTHLIYFRPCRGPSAHAQRQCSNLIAARGWKRGLLGNVSKGHR